MEQTITLNGEARSWRAGSVRETVAAIGLDPERPGVAVALNGAIVPRGRWAATAVSPGDHLEIVQPKAGG